MTYHYLIISNSPFSNGVINPDLLSIKSTYNRHFLLKTLLQWLIVKIQNLLDNVGYTAYLIIIF